VRRLVNIQIWKRRKFTLAALILQKAFLARGTTSLESSYPPALSSGAVDVTGGITRRQSNINL
jgi:hypothetical protein